MVGKKRKQAGDDDDQALRELLGLVATFIVQPQTITRIFLRLICGGIMTVTMLAKVDSRVLFEEITRVAVDEKATEVLIIDALEKPSGISSIQVDMLTAAAKEYIVQVEAEPDTPKAGRNSRTKAVDDATREAIDTAAKKRKAEQRQLKDKAAKTQRAWLGRFNELVDGETTVAAANAHLNDT